MVRINVFLIAYLQYRNVASKQLGPGHHLDQASHRNTEEATLIECFEQFESKLDIVSGIYSKVTVALFVKTFTKLISNMPHYHPKPETVNAYQNRFSQIVANYSS